MIQFTRDVPSDWTLETLLDFVDGESDRVNKSGRLAPTFNEPVQVFTVYKGKTRAFRVTANPKPVKSRED